MKRSDKTAKNPIKKAQPPSGGCVLKHECPLDSQKFKNPAAFRRLCVETRNTLVVGGHEGPAAFRRLCVETSHAITGKGKRGPSRLQAAVC